MADPKPELALYVGEGGNCLSDGTPLIPQETVCQVPFAEAEGSELWEPVKNGKPASSAERNAPPEPNPAPEAS